VWVIDIYVYSNKYMSSPDNLKELMNVVILECLAARGDYARHGVSVQGPPVRHWTGMCVHR